MSEGYVETALIECNQNRSQEALSGNEENPATWNNTLGDIYHLKAGDKVSLYSAFIADRGAGNTKTIEVKGKSLQKEINLTYTQLTNRTYNEGTSGIITGEVYEQVNSSFEIKDNEANIILNYYKNTNGTGYVGLPRHFIKIERDQTESGATFYPFTQNSSVLF